MWCIQLLSVVGQCLQLLFYPFSWNYLYIPLLPMALLQYLQAPVPFLMGLHACHKKRALAMDGVNAESLIIIDLDLDDVRVGLECPLSGRLPAAWHNTLVRKMLHLFCPLLVQADFVNSGWEQQLVAQSQSSHSPIASITYAIFPFSDHPNK